MKRLLTLGIAWIGLLAAPAALNAQGPPTSPDIHVDGRVTFHLKAPEASRVELYGDWPGGPESTKAPMVKDNQGVWSVTVGPLKPDLWTYWFIVDGVKLPDDQNPHFNYDRWGNSNQSLLLIPGPESYNYEMHDVPHGTVSAVWYPAPTLKQPARRAMVYTPPGYETSHDRYPVLYLSSNEETGWILLGRAPTIMDNLISAGKAKPMIVVMLNTQPDAAASSDATDEQLPSTIGLPSRLSPIPDANGGRLFAPAMLTGGQSVASDLVPFIDKAFRTIADREHRAMAGMSSSGAALFYGGVKNMNIFGTIGIFSPSFPALPGAWIQITKPDNKVFPGQDARQSIDPEKVAALLPELNAKANLHLLYLSIGENDGLVTSYKAMKKLLDERGVKYVSVEMSGYHHEWRFWRWCLTDFTPRLFQRQTNN